MFPHLRVTADDLGLLVVGRRAEPAGASRRMGQRDDRYDFRHLSLLYDRFLCSTI